jgi:hypothetical protein
VITRGAGQDTLVSAGLYQQGEFANNEPDEGCGTPVEGICATFEGAPSGLRRFDDDGDSFTDEDPLDGKDNDGDGRIDEDFAGISQQMFRTVYYDTSTAFNQFFPDEADKHTPLGLEITQESYVWTDPQFDDFVGIEFKLRNMSKEVDPSGTGWDIRNAYVGFMVDGDVGIDDQTLNYWEDDQGAFAELDTLVTLPTGGSDSLSITLGYIYDEQGTQGDDVPGYCGVMFLGHTVDTLAPDFESSLAPPKVGIHAFRIWSSGDEDPRDDADRYRFLRGTLGDTVRSISQPTVRENDYRFLFSAGPFKTIPPDSVLTFQVAFVFGLMQEVIDEMGNTRRVPDLANPVQAQRVYNGFADPATGEIVNWATSSPPPPPNIAVLPGDKSVVVEYATAGFRGIPGLEGRGMAARVHDSCGGDVASHRGLRQHGTVRCGYRAIRTREVPVRGYACPERLLVLVRRHGLRPGHVRDGGRQHDGAGGDDVHADGSAEVWEVLPEHDPGHAPDDARPDAGRCLRGSESLPGGCCLGSGGNEFRADRASDQVLQPAGEGDHPRLFAGWGPCSYAVAR